MSVSLDLNDAKGCRWQFSNVDPAMLCLRTAAFSSLGCFLTSIDWAWVKATKPFLLAVFQPLHSLSWEAAIAVGFSEAMGNGLPSE